MRYKKQWTDEENKLLESLYHQNWKTSDIAKKLGRTKAATAVQKRKLRILMRSNWSTKDDDFLIENYAICQTGYLAQRLGRSKKAITLRASFLDLKVLVKKQTKEEKQSWIYAEDTFLIENYKKFRVSYLAERLGRSTGSIYSRIRRLKLTLGE